MKRFFFSTVLLIVITSSLKAQNLQYPSTIKLFNSTRLGSLPIAIGDIDNDGDNDILEFNSDSLCYAWLENKGNSFTNYHLIKNFKYYVYSQVKILDLNKDGLNDIVAISNDPYTSTNGSFYFFKGTGNGNFESTYLNIYFSNLIDYDNDGDMDIVYVQDSSIYIKRNILTGFSNPEKIAHFPPLPVGVLRYVTVADLNSDNHLDLLFLTSGNPQYIYRSLNNGDDKFLKIDTVDKNTGDTYVYLLTDDLNNDNNIDIIAPSYQTYWFESTNNSKMYSKHHLIVEGTHLVIADINKDGYKDVVTYHYDYLQNNKNNTFTRNTLYRDYGKYGYSIASGDIDNDKDIDIIIGQYYGTPSENDCNLYMNNFCRSTYNIKNIDLCEGDSLFIRGRYIKKSGFYFVDTLTNAIGCDSLICKYLRFYPCTKRNIDTTICTDTASNIKTISLCDTTFNNCNDSLVLCNMEIVCHRFIYKNCKVLHINNTDTELTVVFPNPSKDLAFINDSNIQFYELMDISGKLLFRSEKSRIVDLSMYYPGVYLLKIYHKDVLKKIVKLIKE